MSDILTPCRKICALDAMSGICRGCGRNGDEIAGWLAMSDGERRRIMAVLPARLAAIASMRAGETDAQ